MDRQKSKPLFEMLESMTAVFDASFNGELQVPVKRWNLPESFKDCIQQEFREWEGDDSLTVEVIRRTEMAYSCARYCEGEDAQENGYSYWLNYHKEWKPGRGKCTIYVVKLQRVLLEN